MTIIDFQSPFLAEPPRTRTRGDRASLVRGPDILREGPCSQGASWAVCGSGVPRCDFLNLNGIFGKIGKPNFARETAEKREKRLDLKSLKGRKKAEELWPRGEIEISSRFCLFLYIYTKGAALYGGFP